VHPRDLNDVRRSSIGALLRSWSADDDDFAARTAAVPPVVIGEIRFGFSVCWGELVSAPRTPDRLMTSEGRQTVKRAVLMAAARGANVVGLGGLTAPATGAGLRLLGCLPAGVTLTNGNAYTASVVCHNVMEAVVQARHSRIAVLGCTGSVGVAASRLLAEAGLDLVLIGRSAAQAKATVGPVPRAVYSGELSSLQECGTVVVLTNDPAAALHPDMVSPGTIIIDVTQPSNIPPSERGAFGTRDVTVVDGGLVRVPHYSSTYEFAALDRHDTYACLAETYLFAREGIREHSVGRPSTDRARAMELLALKHRVSPRPLRLDVGHAATKDVQPPGVGRDELLYFGAPRGACQASSPQPVS
jgi:predicted amino acid dehydrogenase